MPRCIMAVQAITLCILFWLVTASLAPAAVVPEAGMLLVARPGLPDPRFRDAVILLVQHGPAGSAGLVLNRPSRLALTEVLPALPAAAGLEGSLSYGGPVAPRAFMALVRVQGEPPEPSQKVLGNIYLTGPDQLIAWFGINRERHAYRVFTGYGGWSPGQLAREMTRGDWQVLPADERHLFSPDVAGLWQQLVKQDPVPAH